MRRGGAALGTWLAMAIGTTALSAAPAVATTSDTIGKTSVQQRVVPSAPSTFRFLGLGAGEPYLVRQDLAAAGASRASQRTSLVYFGQLSDFQLADEESPARVEVLDPLSTPLNLPFGSAWRPWEALEPQIDDAMIRQMNEFTGASPVAAGNGSHRKMDFTIDTGDSADNQQLNEGQWVRTLLEGGTLNPNSGVDKSKYSATLCPNFLVPGAAEAARYTGVQDYNDYAEGPTPQFYDPNKPVGPHAAWPKYPGLMDRAQQSFKASGLKVPSYVAFGNHDGLVQGNVAANAAFEEVAMGCLKPIGPVPDPEDLGSFFNPLRLLESILTEPQNTIFVPGDPKRQFVSKKQYKDLFKAGSQKDGHGFGLVEPAQESASNGAAGYYSWSPTPGVRFIALDTVAEAGTLVTPNGSTTSEGNLDNPQFQWLRGQLQAATAANQLVVVFAHHAPESLTADVPDELALPCVSFQPSLGHYLNAGCDLDPRISLPIHLEGDVVSLLHEFPNAIAWVAGHSHDNIVDPFPNPNGPGGFWSIRVAAEADWPQQSRLLEVFDNHDGTLSIFGTILDHVGQSAAPPPGTLASAMDLNDLASVGRTMSFNDLQSGAPAGEGQADDRNVELLVDDPR
jgi:metallophosphoesterase (TIGR03767 family)